MSVVLLAGVLVSCKKDNPVTPPNPTDTTKCDTCSTDTTKCDTCNTPTVDTTSHNFTWTEYSIPTESSLNGVWVFDDSTIYVSGQSLFQYDHGKWSELQLRNSVTNQPLNQGGQGVFSNMRLFGFTPTDFWFVTGEMVIHGTSDQKAVVWRLNEEGVWSSGDGSLLNLWGTSSNDMFFVGENGLIIHYGGGKNWTRFPKVTNEDLRSVWGTGPNDVWACGYNSTTAGTILLHYDGTSWKEDSLSVNKRYATSGFYAVWASNSLGSKHVVTTGAFVGKRDANRKWDIDSEDVGNYLGGDSYVGLQAVDGLAANDFMVGGSWNFISHWNGKSWHRYDELYDYPNGGAIAGISMKSNTACSVGYKNGSWVVVGRRN